MEIIKKLAKNKAKMPEQKIEKLEIEPEVTLLGPQQPIEPTVIASARSCYANKPIHPDEVFKDNKKRKMAEEIQRSTKEAGHLTTRQHDARVFLLDKVTRQFIWSFLHSHQFYNSEQVSQRYVEVKPGSFQIPQLEGQAREIYTATAQRQMTAYHELADLLTQKAEEEYFRIYPGRTQDKEKWMPAIKKRVLEIARYILPVATFAHLYHTVSPLTIIRYKRMCETMDTPLETRIVVDKMAGALTKLDPDFERDLDDTIPLNETLEHKLFQELYAGKHSASDAFVQEFDNEMRGKSSKIIGWTTNAQQLLADSVRAVLGLAKTQISDEQAIATVLDPNKNKYLGETQNVTTLSKICRAMNTISYTFKKKLSHTADSQDQRHRMTPASRPILAAQYTGKPDYITPELIARVPQAREFYEKEIQAVFTSINQLFDIGVPQEFALYLLPNAFPIRFHEQGDLSHLRHKWITRLCYLAQEEIWKATKEEVEQVAQITPEIAKYIHAPCWMRKTAGQKPHCPEGKRYCGVPVWNKEIKNFERLL